MESFSCLVAVGGWWGAHIEGRVQLARGASWGPARCACWGASIQLVPPAGGVPEHLQLKILSQFVCVALLTSLKQYNGSEVW